MSLNKNENVIPLEYIRKLIPLRDIPVQSLQKIAHESPLITFPAGRLLFNRGQQDNVYIYLVKGRVELVGQDDAEVIEGGTSASYIPLDNHQPRQCTARALTDVQILRISKNLIDISSYSAGDDQNGVMLEEIYEDDENIRNKLAYRIYNDYLNGDLKLTSLPEIALRVSKSVKNENNSAYDVAKIIQSDPVIAGQVIKVANSPLYRTDTIITSCPAAVSRIGLLHTRDIVTALAIKQLFKPKTKLVTKRMNNLWKHSTHVAAISSVIAKMIPALNSDRALLAGLIHDIGAQAILSYAEQFPDLIDNKQILDETILSLRGQMGALVLRNWSMASDLVTVALEAEEWDRDSVNGPDYCDVVMVAQIHSYVGSETPEGIPRLIDTKAFQKLPLSRSGPEKSIEILNSAREQIRDMRVLLT
jgi:HD-like signal output (HDOD) protein